MKIDEIAAQNVLRVYGKHIKKSTAKEDDKKLENTENTEDFKKILKEDLDMINYDNKGKLNISPDKKKAIIDFFE